jgi:hypothetical protein
VALWQCRTLTQLALCQIRSLSWPSAGQPCPAARNSQQVVAAHYSSPATVPTLRKASRAVQASGRVATAPETAAVCRPAGHRRHGRASKDVCPAASGLCSGRPRRLAGVPAAARIRGGVDLDLHLGQTPALSSCRLPPQNLCCWAPRVSEAPPRPDHVLLTLTGHLDFKVRWIKLRRIPPLLVCFRVVLQLIDPNLPLIDPNLPDPCLLLSQAGQGGGLTRIRRTCSGWQGAGQARGVAGSSAGAVLVVQHALLVRQSQEPPRQSLILLLRHPAPPG